MTDTLQEGASLDVDGTARQILHENGVGAILENGNFAYAHAPEFDLGDGEYDGDAFLGTYANSAAPPNVLVLPPGDLISVDEEATDGSHHTARPIAAMVGAGPGASVWRVDQDADGSDRIDIRDGQNDPKLFMNIRMEAERIRFHGADEPVICINCEFEVDSDVRTENGQAIVFIRCKFVEREGGTDQPVNIRGGSGWAEFIGCDFNGHTGGSGVGEGIGVLVGSDEPVLVDGQGFNEGDPNTTGKWEGKETWAQTKGAVILDGNNNTFYRAYNGDYIEV